MAVRKLSHLAVCVADAARSERFWTRVLGFQRIARARFEDPLTARLLQVPEPRMDAVYLERDGFVLELLHFAEPGQEETDAPRVMNRTGFTHLSFVVDALAPVLDDVIHCGGHVLETSRITSPQGTQAIFVTDPDHTRIELLEGDFDPRALGGA
jgi:catechol 2,3-dioxygenase-like lactoylglutathione lyase family enzyme